MKLSNKTFKINLLQSQCLVYKVKDLKLQYQLFDNSSKYLNKKQNASDSIVQYHNPLYKYTC